MNRAPFLTPSLLFLAVFSVDAATFRPRKISEMPRINFRARVPLPFDTFHPQGLYKDKDRFLMTAVDKDGKRGYLVEFEVRNEKAKHLRNIELKAGPDEYHPGGLDFDAKEKRLWIPVSQYKKNSTATVLSLSPADLSYKKEGSLQDHIGTVFIKEDTRDLFFFNWDSRDFYVLPLENKGQQTSIRKIDSKLPVAFQDCKSVGGAEALCTGLQQDNKEVAFGSLFLVRATPERLEIVREWPLPRLTPEARLVAQPKSKDDAKKDPTNKSLAHNPLFVEWENDGLLLYFVPHDAPDSVLMVFELR